MHSNVRPHVLCPLHPNCVWLRAWNTELGNSGRRPSVVRERVLTILRNWWDSCITTPRLAGHSFIINSPIALFTSTQDYLLPSPAAVRVPMGRWCGCRDRTSVGISGVTKRQHTANKPRIYEVPMVVTRCDPTLVAILYLCLSASNLASLYFDALTSKPFLAE